jgi:Transglutaminase-like superfamily
VTTPNLLQPGLAHPYAPMSPAALADFVHVPIEEVYRWLDLGLPKTDVGLIDLFACSNWLCWGYLHRCPALARRWRTYLTFFASFVAGMDRPRYVRWEQQRRIYLPTPTTTLSWWIPRAEQTANQQLDQMAPPTASGFIVDEETSWWRLERQLPEAEPTVTLSCQARLTPRAALSSTQDDHAILWQLMREVAGTFQYLYRHHPHADYAADLVTGKIIQPRWSGSCLDCAMTLASLLSDRQRPWRLVTGIVAQSAIANPHFWLETEIAGGEWIPLDPSLPAIVRMVGGDWQTAAAAWTGGLDARRVTIGTVGPGIAGIPGGSTVGSLIGEAVTDKKNAWACLDWVCGDCEATFTEMSE